VGEKIYGYQLYAVKSLRLEIIFVTYTSAELEEISGRVHDWLVMEAVMGGQYRLLWT
jgi:hypothetical protein